ncbi:GNAT family N-acyltransferase [Acuticoccus sp. MNP-M23]|uniref:GNAT family N-acetyltransferase n=1 Tax=Acuticoccus sp. MNP-M23 TaxID=3072793 RepID=UPI002814FC54|nr:GNAT family N-acyltransferase [Acuticoccus sp. MNP-M23]WMS41600.1 GNAT family N-acyltransferase [Acuticoccus sp. MNP-M23]
MSEEARSEHAISQIGGRAEDRALIVDGRPRRRRRTMAKLRSLSPVVRRFVPRGRNKSTTTGPWFGVQPRLHGKRTEPLDRKTPTFGQLGTLEVRLARTAGEIKRAQQIRYQVFYEELAAQPDPYAMATRRDRDSFDNICDHLLVLDHNVDPRPFRRPRPRIVGTYRLLRQEIAQNHGGFYSKQEFEIDPLFEGHEDKRFLEMGRSCVLKPYRDKRTVELLWHGAWSYVLRHKIDVMFGCASLGGTDLEALAPALSYLHHNHLAPPEWRVRALDDRYVPMDRLKVDDVDARKALRALPPLIKGYLRLGAFVADGAVVDEQFGTTDVMIVLPVSGISHRYINYYGANASRHA